MPQHELNRTNWHSFCFPIARARLAKPVKVVVFANRVRFARGLNFPGRVVPARRPRCGTTSTVHARPEGNPLELTKEMVVRATIPVDENPPGMRSVLLPRPEQVTSSVGILTSRDSCFLGVNPTSGFRRMW